MGTGATKNIQNLETMLWLLDWSKTFRIHVDASQFTIGCVMAQPRESQKSEANPNRIELYNYRKRRIGNDLCPIEVLALSLIQSLCILCASPNIDVSGK